MIDVLSRNVVTTIPVAGSPNAVALSADGQSLYTANYINNTVSVISTATNQVVGAPIAVGTTPVSVAVSPNGNTVYATNIPTTRFRSSTRRRAPSRGRYRSAAGAYGVVFSPDGTKAYVANQSAPLRSR